MGGCETLCFPSSVPSGQSIQNLESHLQMAAKIEVLKKLNQSHLQDKMAHLLANWSTKF